MRFDALKYVFEACVSIFYSVQRQEIKIVEPTHVYARWALTVSGIMDSISLIFLFTPLTKYLVHQNMDFELENISDVLFEMRGGLKPTSS